MQPNKVKELIAVIKPGPEARDAAIKALVGIKTSGIIYMPGRTIISRKPSPYTQAEVIAASAKHGKKLVQETIKIGRSTKYALVCYVGSRTQLRDAAKEALSKLKPPAEAIILETTKERFNCDGSITSNRFMDMISITRPPFGLDSEGKQK